MTAMGTNTEGAFIRISAVACDKFPAVKIPAADQVSFCAKRYRKAGKEDPCFDCERGKAAEREERTMTDKKKHCSKEGCTKGPVKDDLCTKHYREKHGVAPFGKPVTDTTKKPPKKAGPRTVQELKKSQLSDRRTVEVDLTDYVYVHAELLKRATEQHRSPDMQILHILCEALGKEKGTL